MFKIDFKKKIHVFFTGIGGISMSALAEILLEQGFIVSGSDIKYSELTKKLEAQGIDIAYEQTSKNITDEIELLVYTAAVKEDHPELAKAKELGIPTMKRAELLGQIMANYKTAIGVSGTHGKTTTTSMLSQILMDGKLDPTVLVGGMLSSIHGNLRIGNSGCFVTEACEYTNSFLSFFPTIEIILNIAEDHMDFFKDIDDIRSSFRQYTRLLPENGILIINGDIEPLSYFTQGLNCKVITFGSNPDTCNYSAVHITYDELARGHYDLTKNGEILGHIELGVTGLHNIYNSLSAIAAAFELGLSLPVIQEALRRYTGTDRRFQKKGEFNSVTIIDDYAHHPDEIRTTLETAKNYPHNKIWCVFQPHTYTRTNAFLKEFASSLNLADHVVLADIYAAREKNTIGISSKDLLTELKKYNIESDYFPSFEEIEKFLQKSCQPGDLLITMGAGDIVKVGERLLGQ